MGVVYRAEDPAIGRTVAIKTIRFSDWTDPGERERLRERLLREAQSAGALSHPGIVTIYDVAEEDGMVFVFMEFVNGPTLEKLIASDQLPDRKTLLDILRQTAAALDYAHRRGIVHRDIKPANIMIDEDGTAKITDFGVARIVSQQMTHTGAMTGTPSYMSPEQIQGHPIDGRADQFALAVIAYEILTGEKPFVADSLAGLVYRIVREEPIAPQRLNPTLNATFETVLRRALSKEPDKRYPTCSSFIQALYAACDTAKGWRPLPPGRSQTMATVAVADAPAIPEPSLDSVELPAPHKRSLLKGLLIGAGAGFVALAVIFAIPGLIREDNAAPGMSEPNRAAVPSKPPAPAGNLAGALGEPQNAAAEIARLRDETDSVSPEELEQGNREAEEEEAPPPRPAASASRTAEPAEVTPATSGGSLDHMVQITTTPSGATLILDNNPELTCTTPCAVPMKEGRHTVMARLQGYREALKIFNVPQDSYVVIGMEMLAGTLVIRTVPEGASIYIDGKLQNQVTPAVLRLPAGKRRLRLVKNGLPAQNDEVEIRDGAIKNYEYSWGR